MKIYVRKRTGELEDFNCEKIATAMRKAAEVTGEFDIHKADFMANKVVHRIVVGDKPVYNIEDIQDAVEDILIDEKYRKTAKAYILYRDQHRQIRDLVSKRTIALVDNYLSLSDWKVRENSNMAFSLQGLNNYIASDISSEYWLNKVYPEHIKQAHISGDLVIHDTNLLAAYCMGWDLEDILLKGFTGVEGKVASKPAKHFRSALGQIVNFIFTLQGETAGAQGISNFDTLLAPFIAADQLTYQQVKQCIQEFIFNINIPTRVGFQQPFSNISFDLNVPDIFKDKPVIIGGEYNHDSTYIMYQSQMDQINRAFCEVMCDGDANGRVFSFPVPTYNLTKDFNWDNENLNPLWKMTGKYGIPYYSCFINSDMKPEDVRSFCCRLRLDNRELRKRGGGLFGASPKTGSLGIVTINLPRIGYLSQSKDEFFKRLEKLVDIAKDSLVIKRKTVERLTEAGLYPYTKFYMQDVKDRTGSYWGNHFSTIGIIGMNEAIMNLMGEDIGTLIGREFAVEVLDFIRELLIKYQVETGDNYNLEATPAEGTNYKLCLLDKKKFVDILCANEEEYRNGAAPYYTNSTHLPVNYTDDIRLLLDLQDDLQTKYTGGTVLHIFLGEEIKDTEVVKKLVRNIATNYKLPYFTLSPTFSVCPSHGYLTGEKAVCDKCGTETEVYSRVVGYLRPIKQWNNGKQSEFTDRTCLNVG